jgi:hypothetical protein
MTTTDAKEFNRLADELDAYAQKYSGDWAKACLTVTWCDMKAIVTALRTAAAASSAGAVKAYPWPKAFRVTRNDDDYWHANISFARYPTDEELQALSDFLRDNHENALIPEPAKAGDAALLREALAAVTVDLISTADKDEDPLEWTSVKQSYAALGIYLSTAQPDTAAQGGKQSDGGAKAGSSPILANKEDQRTDTHGMMPVGDNAANIGCTGVGPSDTAPAEPVRSAFIDALDDKLRELDADWTLHGGPFDSKWVSDVLDAVRNESHPPRSVDIEAIKAAVLPIVLQGFRDRLSGNEVATQVARSIAAMIEGLPSDPIAPAAPVSVDEVAKIIRDHVHAGISHGSVYGIGTAAERIHDAFKMERK